MLADKLHLKQPFLFKHCNIYFLDKNNHILKKEIDAIGQWYELGYINNHKSFADYVYSIFNQQLGSNDSITIRSMNMCCKLDPYVYEFYLKKQIKGIVSKYCFYDKIHKTYKIKIKVSSCELETISYLFFINRFFRHESDEPFHISFHQFSDDFDKLR